ncbi:hypothetical protein LTR96_010861 [Exophiala xenobiotica]|nr:hypothetical protein LTR92_011135 [Exophiala xenobiotica]KAK5215931.1 hypothetical protein LTR72_011056 [Exophiala xenobiotica]KAK5222319.1 hypothetical protein LTR47_010633 [Exophiala xenobiotica]KAK5246942.1 hypothetical protein LTS06_007861 [Exophiala xenobiotica]KAK5263726.1 hypothetical protein LTR96_010861 [Exophiala xenobiotica]
MSSSSRSLPLMEFPKNSPTSAPAAEVKQTPVSEAHMQQATYSQKRYVTILPPKLREQPSRPESKFPQARLPRPLSTNPPRSQSRYVAMLLELDEIPRRHNFYAGLFTWLILAGYIVFPGTFTSLKSSNSVEEAASKTPAGKIILHTVQNASLLWVAGACCLFGVIGIALLWKRWKRNYIWPTLLNAILGLVNTLINVYTAKDGNWSVTATITVTITSACAGISLILFLVYNNWLLYEVKKDHDTQMGNERGTEASSRPG